MTLKTRTLALNPPISLSSALNVRFLYVLMFISIIGLLGFYIFQVNNLTQKIYFNQGYQKDIKQLSQENKFLEVNFSRANSLKNIEAFVQAQNFERIGHVKYIRVLESMVAAK